jgi:hypothetical protein
MRMAFEKHRRWPVRLLLSGLLCLLGGCPIGPASRSGSSGGGGGTTFGPIQFQMPAPDSTVDAPFTVAASGPGILRVFFSVDTTLLLEDWTAPFEITIDPLTLSKGVHSVYVVAQAPSGEERVKSVRVRVVRPRPPLAELLANIAALGGGNWYEIPETPLTDVAWTGAEDRGSLTDIMLAASGGTFDTKRGRLIVWGGGSNSTRNEIYAFDFATLAWVRLTDPSPFPPGGEGNRLDLVTHPDGAPVARHSYDLIEYIPEPIDKLYVGGGTVIGGTGTLVTDPKTYLFDFDTLVWTPGVESHARGLVLHAAVDSSGRVWQHGDGGPPYNRLAMIDVVAQTSTPHVQQPAFYAWEQPAEIDPVRNLYLTVGYGSTFTWDLDAPDTLPVEQATTGDVEIESAPRIGLKYAAHLDRFVAWAGGKNVYVLDPGTMRWTKVPGAGSVDPGPTTPRGVYGRWNYVPSLDVFCVVNAVDTNVFVYRLPN